MLEYVGSSPTSLTKFKDVACELKRDESKSSLASRVADQWKGNRHEGLTNPVKILS